MSDHRPWLATYEAMGLDWQRVPDIPEYTLSDYVRAHASDFGDREALVYLGTGIDYRELDRLADRFANLLRSLDCRAGDVIGIHLPNTPQYAVAMVGAARLGVVTTSIAPLMTSGEIAHQANNAGIKILLTLDDLFESVVQPIAADMPSLRTVLVSGATDLIAASPGARVPVSRLGDTQVLGLTDALAQSTDEPVSATVDLDEVLYLQYTGGTTGPPKGAELTSRNLLLNNAQADIFYGYRTGLETVASAFPLFHIGGAAVLLNALRMAATLMLIPDPRDIDHFVAEMQARPPTVLAAVPALYQMLLNNAAFRALDFSQLRTAISGAAPFSEQEIERLEAVIGTGRFCEVYGMTETSPVQTLNPPQRFKPGYVGVPLPGTEVRIVDAESGEQPMPPNTAGEIIACGPQVMRGYRGMPEATGEALRQHDGRTWMHTGDIGFMDDEGYVRVCDRRKDMLIVGGYKVFSVEVESKVQTLPFVEMCAVVGRPDRERPGNEVVRLFVQRTAGATDAGDQEEHEAEIVALCRSSMAPYKVPREIHFVDALPLTSVGKIDKKALRRDSDAA